MAVQKTKASTAGLTPDALSVFCYQLSLMLQAGIGTEEGVGLLAEDEGDPGLRALLASLHAALLDGAPLSAALAGTGAFPGYMVRMVEIGQASGRLDQVLSALSAYYRREAETASAIRRAILYPAVMAVLIAAVFLVLMVRVLPVFQQVFDQLGVSASPLAQGLLRAGAAGKYVGGALVAALAVAALVLLFLSRRRAKAAGGLETKLLGRGRAGRAVDRSRFASAMALMLSSGLPLDEAMDRTVHLLEGSGLWDALTACQKKMEDGGDFSRSVAECGILEGTQAGLLGAGFRAGVPEQAMEELAGRCQSEADERLSALLSRLEFGLIVALCAAVGLVLLSVMLPLLGDLSAIG